MRRMHLLVAGGLALLAAGPVAAQDLKPSANLFEQKKPAQTPPNDRLELAAAGRLEFAAKPTVICGMT